MSPEHRDIVMKSSSLLVLKPLAEYELFNSSTMQKGVFLKVVYIERHVTHGCGIFGKFVINFYVFFGRVEQKMNVFAVQLLKLRCNFGR
jgi:hypothetical protein